MIQLPQLQESLLIANERLVDRARRRARLFRTGLVTSAAVVSIGGAAVAGIAIWSPQLGHEDGNRPSLGGTPVPADQRAALGVLRREQVAADRSAVAQRALVSFTRQYQGIRPDAVRVVHRIGATDGIALVSVADLEQRAGDARTPAARDALCAYTATGADAQNAACFSLADVRQGRATQRLGDLSWGLVPDGVASVVVHRRDGSPSRIPVASNVFTTDGTTIDPARPEVEWLGADGAAIEPAGGARMTLPVGQDAPAEALKGFHDCGADGGIVPEDVACGADARRWRPKAGQLVPERAPKAP
ncbi:hypothetical protein AB0L40_14005 [Patulibacter sp. NPDC049589]|uniref:hypothetical protein n=1 Tax=Patulibacter sp. NPDC049589 TaxID=3154731 RepID=UPI003432FF32